MIKNGRRIAASSAGDQFDADRLAKLGDREHAITTNGMV